MKTLHQNFFPFLTITCLTMYSTEANSQMVYATGAQDVNNATTSLILANKEDPNTYYVLPPTGGTFQVDNPRLNISPTTCQNVLRVDTIETDKLEQISSRRTQGEATLAVLTERLLSETDADEAAKWLEVIVSTDEQVQSGIEGLRAELEADLEPYISDVGATYRFLGSTGWSDNIARLKNDNPRLSFEPASQFSNVKIHFGSGKEALDISHIVRGHSILGTQDGDTSVFDQVQIDLSLTERTACYINNPQLFGFNQAPALSFSYTFDVPIIFTTIISAEYDVWKVYEFVQTKRKKGGFFSSKTFVETTEDTEFESLFEFKFIDPTTGDNIPIADQIELAKELRQMLLASLASEIVSISGLSPEVASAPGPSAAQGAAGDISKACPANPYCQAANIGLKLLDGIFGRSKSSTRYSTEFDGNVKWRLESGQAVNVTMGIAFVQD